MGAEARVELGRIKDGLHALREQDRHRYVFEVAEPIAVVWAYAVPFGRTVRYTTWELELDVAMEFASAKDADALPLCATGTNEPMGALVVARRRWLEWHVSEVWDRWQSGQTPDGSPLEKLLTLWDRIEPGTWCVRDYHESGTGIGRCDGLSYRPPELVFSHRVTWKLWT